MSMMNCERWWMMIDRNCKTYHRSLVLADFLTEPFSGSKWDMALALGWSFNEVRATIEFIRYHAERGELSFDISSPGTKRNHYWIVNSDVMSSAQASAIHDQFVMWNDGSRKTQRRNNRAMQRARAHMDVSKIDYRAMDDDALLSEQITRHMMKIGS